MYHVLYRGENSERLRKTYKIGKYITITTEFEGTEEYCIKKSPRNEQPRKKISPGKIRKKHLLCKEGVGL